MINDAIQPFPSRRAMLVLWFAAAAVLLTGLGNTALWGSEDRWAEISRMMLVSGDWFHPCINGEIYFDKPLLSYWLIVIPGVLAGGINEFIVRLPSALAGIVGLWAVFKLGEKLFDRRSGYLAAWIMLTCYGFVFWSRKGAADIENLTAIALAVYWYVLRRDKPGFVSYFVFMLICVVGAHAKGLPAVGVPVIAVLPDLVLRGRWKKHLRWSVAGAAAAALPIYLLPFILAAVIPLSEGLQYPAEFDALVMPEWLGGWRNELCGLYLVWRENVLRFFEPFDHKGPFYCYFYELPRIMIPWSIIMVIAFCRAVRDYRRATDNERWLLEMIVLIFLLFSASGSRRWYYILPIVPFCSLLIARYILTAQCNFKTWCFRIHRYAAITAAAAFALAIPVMMLFGHIVAGADSTGGRIASSLAKLSDFSISWVWLTGITCCGIIALLPWAVLRLRRSQCPDPVTADWGALVVAILVMTFMLSNVIPIPLEKYRTEKDFSLAFTVLRQRDNIAPEQIAFFRKTPTAMFFYLQPESPLQIVTTPEEIAAFAAAPGGEDKYIIGLNVWSHRDGEGKRRKSAVDELLRDALGSAARIEPVLREPVFGWESPDKKSTVWKIAKQGTN